MKNLVSIGMCTRLPGRCIFWPDGFSNRHTPKGLFPVNFYLFCMPVFCFLIYLFILCSGVHNSPQPGTERQPGFASSTLKRSVCITWPTIPSLTRPIRTTHTNNPSPIPISSLSLIPINRPNPILTSRPLLTNNPPPISKPLPTNSPRADHAAVWDLS